MPHSINRGKWSLPGIPHQGWRCIDAYDFGAPEQLCDMCEVAEIRYGHEMVHPDFPGSLIVGVMCAEHMAEDYAAQDVEKHLRNLAASRSRWLSRTWRCSARGNSFLNTNDGFHVVVWRDRSGWTGKITDSRFEQEVLAKQHYPSQEAVKLAAFDALQVMKKRRP